MAASVTTAPRAPWVGLVLALALMAAGVLVPRLTGWDVHVRWYPPLHAVWDPRVGPGTIPALLLGLLAAAYATRVAQTARWGRLLIATYVAGVAWLICLALVDGPVGISAVLEHDYEYLNTARSITDVPGMLEEYVSRIGFSAAPDNWPVHLAGHPPGAVLFFIALVRVGLGGGLAAGLAVALIAASTAAGVMTVLRTLGAEQAARRAAPFLVFTPAAIWMCVSADAVFGAFAAWGMAALSKASVAQGARESLAWSVVAGAILGYVVMMSYGLPLLGLLAVAILVVGGSFRPLVPATLAAVAVVLAFYVYGFAWWEAFPELRQRYWDGVASNRPPEYWMWGNLAALAFSAGPVMYAGVAHLTAVKIEQSTRVVRWLAGAGVAMILAADLSQMSRAEVERIWLPFVPWLLVSCALLPERWRRWGLIGQIVAALVTQHLLWTDW
jgi:methylthioxylose transferase